MDKAKQAVMNPACVKPINKCAGMQEGNMCRNNAKGHVSFWLLDSKRNKFRIHRCSSNFGDKRTYVCEEIKRTCVLLESKRGKFRVQRKISSKSGDNRKSDLYIYAMYAIFLAFEQ